MKQFSIPPLLPLIGSTLGNYIKVLDNGPVEPRYYFKVVLTGLIILIATPFQIFDYFFYRKKLKEYSFAKEPLFILGHWRSGTTLVHNCLCQDKTSGYVTTYHSLFPHNLRSKLLFKSFARIGMPEKRPSDDMKLNVSYPQEEEFALGSLHPNFYYNFFYFPREYRKYYNQAIRMNVGPERKKKWKKAYINLLKTAALNTNGKRMIVKNPANTARIRTILEMFPGAKFLFIYRNPLSVYLSTRRFFYSLFPSIWLHQADKNFINHMILDVYKKMMEDYTMQKQLIPPGNIMEIKFEDFENNPVAVLRSIYTGLLNEDFENVRERFAQYMKSIRNYKKNRYSVKRNTVESVSRNWGKYMHKWNYHMPDHIVVT